jgi:hypothetical protein
LATSPAVAGETPVLSHRLLGAAGSPPPDAGVLARLEAPAAPAGILPEPVIESTPSVPLAHDIQNVLALEVETSATVHAVLMGGLAGGGIETFPVRTITPEEGRALWTLEPRPGVAGELTSFTLALASAGSPAPVVVRTLELLDGATLSDRELLDASLWRPMESTYRVAPLVTTPQEVVAIVPGLLALRYQGGSLRFLMDGRLVREMPVEVSTAADAELLVRSHIYPSFGQASDRRRVALELVGPSGEVLPLGERPWSFLSNDRDHGHFEVPFQSVRDYAVFAPNEEDLLLVTALENLHTAPEPAWPATTVHDVQAHLLSTRSGRFETTQVWRTSPAAGLYNGGFLALGGHNLPRIQVLFASALEASGLGTLHMAVAALGARFVPAASNPMQAPAAAFLGWEPGERVTFTGLDVTDYGNTYVMLQRGRVAGGKAFLASMTSPDLRSWADGGIVDSPLGEDDRHLALAKRGDVWYLLSDDATAIFWSNDPLRRWHRADFTLGADWTRRRLVPFKGSWFLFGLADVGGKNAVRWIELEWPDAPGGAVPLPVPADGPKLLLPSIE